MDNADQTNLGSDENVTMNQMSGQNPDPNMDGLLAHYGLTETFDAAAHSGLTSGE